MSRPARVRWVAVKTDGENVGQVDLDPGEQVLNIEPGDMGWLYVYIARHVDWRTSPTTGAKRGRTANR